MVLVMALTLVVMLVVMGLLPRNQYNQCTVTRNTHATTGSGGRKIYDDLMDDRTLSLFLRDASVPARYPSAFSPFSLRPRHPNLVQ